MSTSRRLIGAAAASCALLACHSTPTAPSTSRPAELLRVSVPSSVTPSSSFSVVAYYGRGACENAQPLHEQGTTGARLGMRLTSNATPGTICPSILLADSVKVDVVPPYTLPYTVRLERANESDSIVVITTR